jgi:hypothetical protein
MEGKFEDYQFEEKTDFKSKISKLFLWKENLKITNLNRKT